MASIHKKEKTVITRCEELNDRRSIGHVGTGFGVTNVETSSVIYSVLAGGTKYFFNKSWPHVKRPLFTQPDYVRLRLAATFATARL